MFRFQASAVAVASAKQIVITVGGNTTDNATAVFQPAEVTAKIGDTVLFNCESSIIYLSSAPYAAYECGYVEVCAKKSVKRDAYQVFSLDESNGVAQLPSELSAVLDTRVIASKDPMDQRCDARHRMHVSCTSTGAAKHAQGALACACFLWARSPRCLASYFEHTRFALHPSPTTLP